MEMPLATFPYFFPSLDYNEKPFLKYFSDVFYPFPSHFLSLQPCTTLLLLKIATAARRLGFFCCLRLFLWVFFCFFSFTLVERSGHILG